MAKESPVLTYLESLGGRPRAGRRGTEIAHFGDAAAEHRAARRGAGIFDRAGESVVRITGADRVEFLQRILTSDVSGLASGEGSITSLLTGKGKFIALFRLLAYRESMLALVDDEAAGGLVEGLGRYSLIDDVEPADESACWAALHVAGPLCRGILERITGADLSRQREGSHTSVKVPGLDRPAIAVSHCPTGEEGFDLFVPRDLLEAAWRAILDAGDGEIAPAGAEAFHTLRLEAGTALFGVDFRDDLGPIEAGMEKAVSFTKGCYIGQEVIAKMHYRGKPPKRITGLGIEGETVPEPGATVFAGGEVAGRITSAAAGPSIGRTIALAVVRTRHLEAGSALHLDLGGREVAATPEETPFR